MLHYRHTLHPISTNKLDLTGKSQHGFKRKKSTATAGALLQLLYKLFQSVIAQIISR